MWDPLAENWEKGLATALVVFGLAVAATWSGCGNQDNSNRLSTVTDGKLTIGSDISYPPFEFGRRPHYRGFDIELTRTLADRAGLDAAFADVPFGSLLSRLDRDEVDMVASALTITKSRNRRFDFSTPYFSEGYALLVEDSSSIDSFKDLRRRIVGVLQDSPAELFLRRDPQGPEAIHTYERATDAVSALIAGQVQAVIADSAVAGYATKSKRRRLEVRDTIFTGRKYGFAFKKGSDPLRGRLNRELRSLRKDGTYAKLYRRWFGDLPMSHS